MPTTPRNRKYVRYWSEALLSIYSLVKAARSQPFGFPDSDDEPASAEDQYQAMTSKEIREALRTLLKAKPEPDDGEYRGWFDRVSAAQVRPETVSTHSMTDWRVVDSKYY